MICKEGLHKGRGLDVRIREGRGLDVRIREGRGWM